jgi:hypothetical protein
MKKTIQVNVNLLGAAIASLFVLAPLPAAAQDAGFGKPAGVPWGPIVVYPEGTVTIKHNDNLYSQPNGPGEKSATISVLAPSVKLEAKDGPHTYDVTARVEDGHYSSYSSANYTDYGLTANAQWVFSGRVGLKLMAQYLKGHDDQGAVPGVGLHTKPDKWNQSTFSGVAGYGAEGAQGRVEVDFGLINKEYDNFRRDGFGNPDNLKRDYDTTRVGATFYWRVMPKTQILFNASRAEYDYSQNSFIGVGGVPNWTNVSSTEIKYQVGVTWEATAQTTGIFKVGNTEKNFWKSGLSSSDYSDPSWEAAVKWSPLTYSNFDFMTAQRPGESSIGNASLDTLYGASWNHAWNSRLSSVVSYNYLKNEYQYNSGTAFQQTDKTDTYNLKLNYQWTRVFKVGGFYEYTDKTSNNPGSEYKRNIYGVFLNAAI